MICPDCNAPNATLVRCECCDAVRCYACAVPANPLDEDLCTSPTDEWIVRNPKMVDAIPPRQSRYRL